MRDHEAVRRLLADQDDLATRSQLLGCGGTDEWIEAQLTAGRWQRVARKVYCATTGALTARQLDRAALLAAGPVAALSHASAARRWGLSRPGVARHITVPYGRSADPRPGLTLHRSRAFRYIVIDDHDLPTVSAADTCVDLAVTAPDARAAMRTVLHAALGMRVPNSKEADNDQYRDHAPHSRGRGGGRTPASAVFRTSSKCRRAREPLDRGTIRNALHLDGILAVHQPASGMRPIRQGAGRLC